MRWFASWVAITLAASTSGHADNEPQVWHLDWVDLSCNVSTGDPASAGLMLRMVPGDPDPAMHVVGSSKLLRGDVDKVSIGLNPAGKTFRVHAYDMATQDGRRHLMLREVGADFPAALAKASELRIDGLKQPVSIPVKGAGEAVAALRQCIDEHLPAWGVDPKMYDALRTPPTNIPDYVWISGDRYPRVGLSANDTGEVIARLNVDATGKATSCAIVISSGKKELDDFTCASALAGARFNPAIGADGQRTAAPRIIHVKFQID